MKESKPEENIQILIGSPVHKFVALRSLTTRIFQNFVRQIFPFYLQKTELDLSALCRKILPAGFGSSHSKMDDILISIQTYTPSLQLIETSDSPFQEQNLSTSEWPRLQISLGQGAIHA